MHDLLRVADLSPVELLEVLDLAREIKADRRAFRDAAAGTCVAVIMEKPSLRTRFSIEAGLARIGSRAITAGGQEGLGTREPVSDGGRVLGRYVDAIALRTFAHSRVEELAAAAGVPVVNALSDAHHPLQALADLMTLADAVAGGDPRGLKDVKLAYVGDGNNVCHSLIEAAAMAGLRIACGCPAGYEPAPDVVGWAREAGGEVEVTADPAAAVSGAVAVYTDVWASMGQEDEADARRERFAGFQVNQALMDLAEPGAVFLHCLPAHRGEEVAAEVIDGPASRVFDQAENRMHTATAVFVKLLGGR